MKTADDIIDYKAVGARIKAERRNSGLSQKALAAAANISTVNLSHIERGTTMISLSTLVKIANSLEVSISELLCGSPPRYKVISQNEIADIIDKCSPKEARIIAATVGAMFKEMHGSGSWNVT